jgi:alpha-1,2-mannosyltransferase
MTWLDKNRIPLYTSLLMAAFCLSLYVGLLWRDWRPILQSQPLMAPKIQEPVAKDYVLHWTNDPLPWPYPPTALLVDLPLALLPYFVSLALWLIVTLSCYVFILYKIAPRPLTILWALAFFGAFTNFAQGQNGFLSATLLGGGVLCLANTPFVGGLLLGLLTYKPHIAMLIPLALLLSREWRALWGVITSGTCLILASAAVFGYGIWGVFLNNIPGTITNLQMESAWFSKMPSAFAAIRLVGGGVAAAWICQGVAMLVAIILVARIWSSPASQVSRVTALVLAILLFSPHIFYYDLTILALPLAWFWWEGTTVGWLPWEKELLIMSWGMPLVSAVLSYRLNVPIGPFYLVLPLILLLRRYSWEQHKKPKYSIFLT